MAGTVVVVIGGEAPPAWPPPELPPGARVIAADSGVDHAAALGWPVHLVVGDLDSVSGAGLAALEAAGVPVERHPVAKDRTDLELALERAVAEAPDQVVVVGGRGGRLDHLLGNALILASPALAGVPRVSAWCGPARAHVVRDRLALAGRPGALVSLLPVHGPARGVRTEGLAFPLHGEDLPAGTGRGLSNRFAAPEAAVSLAGGVLLVVAPGAE